MLPTFKYRTWKPKPPNNTGAAVLRTGSQEVLTKSVDGQPASDLEERFANSLKTYKAQYSFRTRISSMVGAQRLTQAHANMAGELEIDFLVSAGQTIPVMIDGEIGHFFTPYQKLVDDEKADLVDQFGAQYGWAKTVRVPFVELRDQNSADDVARRLINGTYVARFTT